MNPIFLKDCYKVDHIRQYPEGTNLIFSNFTPRKSRLSGIDYSVLFGLKYFIEAYLIDQFNDNFFRDPCSEDDYQRLMSKILGINDFPIHIKQLHDVGYLPIEIYALPELTEVPCGVPALVIFNTHPDFFWLPGMLETLMSCTLWGTCTSATIANEYRKILDKFAKQTSDIPEFVDYQAHDFSMRGMFGIEASIVSGMAHLQYFKGSDSIPAILADYQYYDKPLGISSISATEHSVMCANGKENEFEYIKKLITEIYPSGMISIVCDSWDFWKVVSEYLPKLKNEIMARDGKVVIRPDSGDPVKIICGDDNQKYECAGLGLIECLWEIFGGTMSSKGYRQLDPHIGAIYGDSITLDRANTICSRLEAKMFASTNVVFGVGSYSYQYNTRDSLGWAMKATYCEVNGLPRNIYKDPITDDGTKKSHKGILKVVRQDGKLKCLQEQTWESFNEKDNELKLVFKDGKCFL